MKRKEPLDIIEISDEQKAYALVLGYAVKLGYLLLLAAGIIYFTGLIAPSVPLDEIHNYWGLDLEEYQEQVQGPHRPWAWVNFLDKSDYLAFIPVVFLGAVSIFCYLWILPILLRQREYVYLFIVAVEVVILVMSATGFIGGGH